MASASSKNSATSLAFSECGSLLRNAWRARRCQRVGSG